MPTEWSKKCRTGDRDNVEWVDKGSQSHFTRMCYEEECGRCGKTTWGGCGDHVAAVYRRIPEAQRCLCRDWPGVSLVDLKTTPPPTPLPSDSKYHPLSACACTIQ
ncbi:hypothetical protein ZIOFF_074231 [Zingiber officinale]|uniref:Uncharacterized protein n=1 Tax=Zingiber officinale TaxID=94328 RepID=A0A8J5C746_ZINOF|nr:hypothetical protein ZIOFF_074231 [Zingiber officinale]